MRHRVTCLLLGVILPLTPLGIPRGLAAAAVSIDRLTDAMYEGEIEPIRTYLENGGDANAVDDADFSLLYSAVSAESVEAAKLLIAAGADVNVHSPGWDMPLLNEAAALGNSDMVDLLLKHGADPLAKDKFGGTAVEEAAFCGSAELVARLKALGVGSDHPLHVAAGIGDMVMATVKKGKPELRKKGKSTKRRRCGAHQEG